MIKQEHAHPVVTTANTTREIPNRVPRATTAGSELDWWLNFIEDVSTVTVVVICENFKNYVNYWEY